MTTRVPAETGFWGWVASAISEVTKWTVDTADGGPAKRKRTRAARAEQARYEAEAAKLRAELQREIDARDDEARAAWRAQTAGQGPRLLKARAGGTQGAKAWILAGAGVVALAGVAIALRGRP